MFAIFNNSVCLYSCIQLVCIENYRANLYKNNKHINVLLYSNNKL